MTRERHPAIELLRSGRRRLLNHPLIAPGWSAYWAGVQERRIRADDRSYGARADAAGIPRELPDAELRARLRARLAERGISPSPRERPHVVYASPLDAWERPNIPPALEAIGTLSPFYLADHGFDDHSRDWLRQRDRFENDLVQFVAATHARQPVDVFVAYLSGYHVRPGTIEAIGRMGIPTCAFWWDDRLYFRGHRRGGRYTGAVDLAAAYDLNLTNASRSVVKYLVEGGLAMFWPLGANPDFFRPLPGRPFEYDVSFIGQRYGQRPGFIEALRRRGLRVATFGPGWDSGPIASTEMVEVYARTRINLGISGIGYSMKETCLKGREFEVPMAGTVYLTMDQPDLPRVFDPGREVVGYRDVEDCAAQIHRLLGDPDRCEHIRQAARARSLRDHTWVQRFRRLFEMLGVGAPGAQPS